MTDSMNFGPDWIRNLSSEGTSGSAGGGGGGVGGGLSAGGAGAGTRYQLADYRYGREEMLALFDRNGKPPQCLSSFKSVYSDTALPPLALLPSTSEEERTSGWPGRPVNLGGPSRGRGGSLERGGRGNRGRGGFSAYNRPNNYDSGWGNGDSLSEWSPRKEYNPRAVSMDNWRRGRMNNEEDDGWRMGTSGRGTSNEKWARHSSWRADGEDSERSGGPSDRGGRWHDLSRGPLSSRRSWDNEDHLPEWATENPLESGGSFDDRGAFHGSDEELMMDGKSAFKKEGLQKSTSQQHISPKTHPPLMASKSTMSLVKDDPDLVAEESESSKPMEITTINEAIMSTNKVEKNSIIDKNEKNITSNRNRGKSEGPQSAKSNENHEFLIKHKAEVNDFEKLQEDFVSKLVIDEEPLKQNILMQQHQQQQQQHAAPPPQGNSFNMPGMHIQQSNLMIPGQDRWFYQDPQGQMQGPFASSEMSEWFKAGYFGQDLKVRRQCDERFFLLGELIAMCNSNPFSTNMRFPVLKNDISKMPDLDRQFQFLPQIQAYKQAQARILADPWSAIAVQQQELTAQRLIMQQQQVQQDIANIMHQHTPSNPLMHMINQMQQANKLPTGIMPENNKPPNIAANNMDPHLHMQMTNYLSLQNRLPTGGGGGPIPVDNLSTNLSGHAAMPLQGLGLNVMPTVHSASSSSVEHHHNDDTDPITKLLKQLQEKQPPPQFIDSLWQQNQFSAPSSNPPSQWPNVQQVQPELPLSMWDVQQHPQVSTSPVINKLIISDNHNHHHSHNNDNIIISSQQNEKDKIIGKSDKLLKEPKQRDDEKDLKRRKKAEEDLKREAEEKRKQEQRKLEAEKRAEIDKKRKEEEKIKKELEKAKKEAEEKRLRELEEKRKQKEQRKLEEEARKRTDEERRKLEDDRIQREKEQREREERLKNEERRQEMHSMAKVAPWSQANSAIGLSLAEIQKAEKERKIQDAALQAQKAQERELHLQQQQQLLEKSGGGIQLGWAKRVMEPRKVKSLAEIQAEEQEQERIAKEATEARLKKEKDSRETAQIQQSANSIWSGQSLTWANATTTTTTQSQWSSSSNISGFWEDPVPKPPQLAAKPSNVSKSNSTSTMVNNSSKQSQINKSTLPSAPQQQKAKPKKDEIAANNSTKNHNNNIDDEFTNWCYKALSSIDTTDAIDIPTFVTFLRDIESAFEVREYCRVYLGENNSIQQFTTNFLEKRRSFKPKNAHKDDMCSPAPAITPSMHGNNSEFQEVKGKNKKGKKSKMLKVDARILGFNVTSAPDRINVGDRDYGDNS